MTNLISNYELTSKLELILPSCEYLTIISAFMTQPAISWLSQLVKENRPKVQLVGRFSPKDFLDGASDLNALKDCIKDGFEIRALANLHAKIYQIDDDIIFNGSANLTGKGLALVQNENFESCSRIEATIESKAFIKKIVDASTELTTPVLEEMEKYLDMIKATDIADIPVVWPDDIVTPSKDLFVSDFPLGQPGAYVSEYSVNPSLPFAQIENAKSDFLLASALFKNCKAYRWLNKQIRDNKNERDLGFGQVSQLLHAALSDDPAPYRRDLKGIQANFYSYLKLYASDEIENYVPGGRSEVLRLKGW